MSDQPLPKIEGETLTQQRTSIPADLLADIIADLPESEVAILSKIKEKLLGIAIGVMPAPEPKKEPKVVASLADLQNAVDEHFELSINYNGVDYLVKARRLRPFESAQLTEILSRPIPPVIRGDPTKPQTDRYNREDPKFVKESRDAYLTARAIAIYRCVPVVADGKPNLTDPRAITEYIQGTEKDKGVWNDAILSTLWEVLNDGGVRKAAYTNFT